MSGFDRYVASWIANALSGTRKTARRTSVFATLFAGVVLGLIRWQQADDDERNKH
jgi:hypothetical protein